MEPLAVKGYKKSGPEKELQEKIVAYLRARDWAVITTHGNEYQYGLPDLYCAHYTRGVRWIEVKHPVHYKFTPAQLEVFPLLQSKGVGIWIFCYCDDYEYEKLQQPPNWYTFLGKSSMLRSTDPRK